MMWFVATRSFSAHDLSSLSVSFRSTIVPHSSPSFIDSASSPLAPTLSLLPRCHSHLYAISLLLPMISAPNRPSVAVFYTLGGNLGALAHPAYVTFAVLMLVMLPVHLCRCLIALWWERMSWKQAENNRNQMVHKHTQKPLWQRRNSAV